MDLNLRGRRALITGSSKGIGLAIARSLAAEGCDVQLVARTQSELDKATAAIRADYGVAAVGHAADLSDSAGVKAVAAAAGEVDILVNSAGAIPRGTLLDIDEARWRKAWDLKLFGAINLTREIYGPMCQRGKGVIVNIAGMAGERPDAYYIAGSVANAALIMFSRSLGGDSIRFGVRVLAVNPGPVETEKHINDTRRLAKEKFGDENRWRDVMSGLPMKRAATTDEVSGMVAFLCSDYSSYISGASILIDGGLLTDSAVGVRRG
ncbi:MAG: SDR family oxidoreductase [Alphaproteobacteria bacterium]|nr:SDR family oxidoreductase [Alphaproteobacteria bacterium]